MKESGRWKGGGGGNEWRRDVMAAEFEVTFERVKDRGRTRYLQLPRILYLSTLHGNAKLDNVKKKMMGRLRFTYAVGLRMEAM